MTNFEALFIKYLRITCDGSWRWVTAKYSERYILKIPFNLHCPFGGNQLDGMKLCSLAQELLKEETNQGWN